MTDILTRRRRRVDTAKAHLEQARRQQPEVDAVAQPMEQRDKQNHLAHDVARALRGHS